MCKSLKQCLAHSECQGILGAITAMSRHNWTHVFEWHHKDNFIRNSIQVILNRSIQFNFVEFNKMKRNKLKDLLNF